MNLCNVLGNQNYLKTSKDKMKSQYWLNKIESDQVPDCYYSAPIL